ncbi:MAG: hypothetical protein ACXWW0_00240 [Bacteroidia bacterium]
MKNNYIPIHDTHLGSFNTETGAEINLQNPSIEMITRRDIVTALSKICRFGGHVPKHYSVAQHTVLVMLLAPAHLQQAALLHDAAEAYLGDVIKPLKVLLGDAYANLEHTFEKLIFEKFNVDINLLQKIKSYDMKALEMEHEYFRDINKAPFEKMFRFKGFHMPVVWNPAQAEIMFTIVFTQAIKNTLKPVNHE